MACHLTSAVTSPRPFTTVYWPNPQIVIELALMHTIVASVTSPITSGSRKRVITSVPRAPTARPAMLANIVHSAPLATLCCNDMEPLLALHAVCLRHLAPRPIASGAFDRAHARRDTVERMGFTKWGALALCLAFAFGVRGCQPLYGGKPEHLKNPEKKRKPPEAEVGRGARQVRRRLHRELR